MLGPSDPRDREGIGSLLVGVCPASGLFESEAFTWKLVSVKAASGCEHGGIVRCAFSPRLQASRAALKGCMEDLSWIISVVNWPSSLARHGQLDALETNQC